MRVEDVIEYSRKLPLLFELREYTTGYGDYYIEAVVFCTLISDTIGIIIEQDTFSPLLSYKKSEVDRQFQRLNEIAERSIAIIEESSKLFNDKYVRRTKGVTKTKNKGFKSSVRK